MLGVGLIGASLLRAVRKRLPETRVVAWSRSPDSREFAAAWAEVAPSPAVACEGADLVVAAGPVDALGGLLREAAAGISPAARVTDVGSTKRGAHAAVAGATYASRFAGSHPMAGSEKGGAAASQPDLFAGRACIVTSLPGDDPAVAAAIGDFWRRLGSRVSRMTPEAHDAAVAEISHLPHAAASALAAMLERRKCRTDLAAGGLRDTTRVAAGDPSLWVPILMENADHLVPLLEELARETEILRQALSARDDAALRALLSRARDFRQGL